jgi:L-glyceraldehyde 3-phosphate reductase
MTYTPADDRYERMLYRRTGRSGLKLPPSRSGSGGTSATTAAFESGRAIVRRAFDLGITHFGLANNQRAAVQLRGGELRVAHARGPAPVPPRARHLDEGRLGHVAGRVRDGGSRKYLLRSLGESLGRMGLDFVDTFYSYRFDPETPLDETTGALDTAVRQGRRST